jgi:prolyl oligopeptidase PreP (S9A serine peptidase family)
MHTDPYLWLEDDSAATRAWCAEQQARTAAQLDADPRFAALADEVLEHLRDDERVPFVEAHAGWWHHFLQSPAHPRGVYRRIRPDDYRANRDAWEVLFDLDALAAAEGVDWHLAGIDHCTERPARCLLSLSADGGDAACLREYDLDARAFVAEGFQLPPGKHSVTWRDPDSLYAAVVLSEADATASGYPREVKLWLRGQPFAQAHSLLKAEHRALAVSAWRMLNPDGGEPVDIIEEALSFYRTRYWRVLPDLSRQALPLPPKVDIDGVVAGQLIVRLNQAWGDLDAGVLLALDWQALCAGDVHLGRQRQCLPAEVGQHAPIAGAVKAQCFFDDVHRLAAVRVEHAPGADRQGAMFSFQQAVRLGKRLAAQPELDLARIARGSGVGLAQHHGGVQAVRVAPGHAVLAGRQLKTLGDKGARVQVVFAQAGGVAAIGRQRQ